MDCRSESESESRGYVAIVCGVPLTAADGVCAARATLVRMGVATRFPFGAGAGGRRGQGMFREGLGVRGLTQTLRECNLALHARGLTMPLPDLTALQFLILRELLDGEQSGRQLRAALNKYGARKTLAAFYQLMARLEDARFVVGRSESQRIDDVTITTRYYTLTGSGEQAVEKTLEFYAAGTTGGLAHA